MKIALSASFFNCPPVTEILNSCDVVYTTNNYALENFAHKDVRAESTRSPKSLSDEHEYISFTTLFKVFNKWVAETATDEELGEYIGYFGESSFEKMREKARGSLLIPVG